jgi:hypothetical protein
MKRILALFSHFALAIALIFLVSCTQSNNNETLDYDAFVQLLTENGFQYTEESPDAAFSFLTVACRPIRIGDDIISVYEYESNEKMEADAACIDKSGFSVKFPDRGTNISWVSDPYFYKRGMIIVNYVGINEDILAFLGENFGEAFAGHTAK